MIGIQAGKLMIYFFLAVLLLITVALIYYKYQKSDDPKSLVKSIAIVGMTLFFTYISKVIFIHKPIFILHLALVLISWGGVYLYLIKNRLNLLMVLAPLASTLFFLAVALFFREN